MIKISHDSNRLNNYAKEHLRILNTKPFYLERNLDDSITKISGKAKKVLEYFKDNLPLLICSQPEKLFDLSKNIDKKINEATWEIQANFSNPTDEIRRFNILVKKAFNYDRFIRIKNGGLAYDHAQKLDSPVCLYCNRQYTFTLNKANRKTRPQFDHFFDKANYPYYALSFYNLVPCCSICNSNFKGSTKFKLDKNIHPLIEGTEKIFKFTIDVRRYSDIHGRDVKLNIKKYHKTTKITDYQRAQNNLDIFAIVPLYNMHQTYLKNLVINAHIYNKSMKKELMKYRDGKVSLFQSEKELNEHILGTPISPKNFGKTPLSKLTYDLAKELNLLE